LVEISGLANYNDEYLLAIQDEYGVLFVIDNTTGKLTREIKFGKRRDYEGIEYVGNEVIVLSSNGTLYKFDYPEENLTEIKAEEVKTSLDPKNEMEGLGYYKDGNRLLIASKESGIISGKKSKGKSVFVYNLSSGELMENPVCSITKKSIKNYLSDTGITLPSKVNFKPSAIAVHPITNDLYILTSVGKALLIMDMEENILNFTQLNPYLFRQPEGLSFTSDGTMYISNEGSGMNARILKFSYRK
jgi:uncharacterized protein YjiK